MLRLAGVLIGVAAMSLAGAVIGGFKVWTTIKPYKRWKERRARKKAEAELSSELIESEVLEESMASEPTLRTSTKAGGAGLVTLLLLQVAERIPWEPLAALVQTPEFAQLITLAVMYVVARVSKTPVSPGKI